jgi:HEAT repeat protein
MSHLTATARGLVCLALLSSTAAAQKKKGKAAPLPAGVAIALVGGDVDAATRAAVQLGKDRSGQGLDLLLDALALGLHPQVAIAALDALGERRKVGALDTLVAYVDHRNPKVRASAVSALGAIDDRRVEKHILRALHDGHDAVRGAAAGVVAARKLRDGVAVMMKLMVKGDESVAAPLAAMAGPELARDIAETIGRAPDPVVARCLGAILLRPDFKPESARLEVVRALGRVPGQEALDQLTGYVASVPPNPPRASRAEAEKLLRARGGK